MSKNTIFEIGSNSKSFLAVIYLKLETEGKLNLEDTVGKYLPHDYPNWHHITLKQLLNMTSGLPDYMEKLAPALIKQPLHKFNYDEILAYVKDETIQTAGAKYNYSNTNYVLLAKIIEQITKNSVKHEITERIIKHLNLTRTFYIEHLVKNEIPQGIYKDFAHGTFKKIEGVLANDFISDGHTVSLSSGIGAGSMVSNTEELNLYFQELLAGNLLTPTERQKLTTVIDIQAAQILTNGVNANTPSGYGLGLGANYNSNIKDVIFSHDGRSLGYYSLARYFSSTGATYTANFNSRFSDPNVFSDQFKKLEEEVWRFCKN